MNQDDFFRPLQGIVYIVSGHQYSDSLVNQHVYDFVDNDRVLRVSEEAGSSKIMTSGFMTSTSAIETCFF